MYRLKRIKRYQYLAKQGKKMTTNELTVAQLKSEYEDLYKRIKETLFPVIKEKREKLGMGKFMLEKVTKEWILPTSKLKNFTPDVLFRLEEFLDGELLIHEQMKEVNVHDSQ